MSKKILIIGCVRAKRNSNAIYILKLDFNIH